MLTRRTCLLGGVASAALPSLASAADNTDRDFDPESPLPHKEAFAPFDSTYLNSASQHPVSIGAKRAVNKYLDYKSFSTDTGFSNFQTYERVLENYARLIGADTDEVCYVQSTTVGENLILKALGYQRGRGRIVTDDLHYVGSLPTYTELEKLGVEIVTLRADDNGRMSLDQFDEAITAETGLVCVSSISMVNGFQHDLKGLCEIAHAKNAFVYADVVHEVGSMPFDVRRSGVDFCSAAGYKWLMGEQGLGFLYARKDRLAELERPWFGHYQLQRRTSFGFPDPRRSIAVTDYTHLNSVLGYFAMGSQANINAALLDHSLDYLLTVGPDRIQTYRRPLLNRLQDALPSLGYESITPTETSSALVSFRHDGNTEELHGKLDVAKIAISVAQFHMRISPTVFNRFCF